jgi:hypothetical protein
MVEKAPQKAAGPELQAEGQEAVQDAETVVGDQHNPPSPQSKLPTNGSGNDARAERSESLPLRGGADGSPEGNETTPDESGTDAEAGQNDNQPANSEPDRSESNGHPPGHSKPNRHTSSVEAVKDKFLDQKQKIMTKTHPTGGFDDTPLPDAPPGYTIRFIFHRATNLPVADLATRASDPFLFATLRAAVPKRHKEDPDLSHRTRTLRRCTDAQWDDEWIVANVPASGFSLKCRIYDEDTADHNDRLGNVTIKVPHLDETWKGFPPPGEEFRVKKRVGSKRAYLLKGVVSALSRDVDMTPSLFVSAEVLGKSDPPHAQMYTVGPSTWMRHFSPMIGRLTGI